MTGVQTCALPISGIPLVSANEENIGVLKVDQSIVGRKDGLFSLIVKGDSMNLAEIDGKKIVKDSYIVVQKNVSIEDGDIVVAIVENCATVKKFKHSKDMVILYPDSSNPLNQPIYLDKSSDSLTNGKVIKVLENPIP